MYQNLFWEMKYFLKHVFTSCYFTQVYPQHYAPHAACLTGWRKGIVFLVGFDV